MAETTTYVGIDVAKATLDLALAPTGPSWQVANDAPGRILRLPLSAHDLVWEPGGPVVDTGLRAG